MMRFLSLLVLIFVLTALGLGLFDQNIGASGLVVVGLLLAGATWRGAKISRFLQIFLAIFATEFVSFGAIDTLNAHDLWPAALADVVPPESLPITVGVFGLIVFVISYLKGIAAIMRIADRYFDDHMIVTVRLWPFPPITLVEQTLARGFVVFLVVVNQAQVGISVRLSISIVIGLTPFKKKTRLRSGRCFTRSFCFGRRSISSRRSSNMSCNRNS